MTIAAFDLDGTLTSRDTFVQFVRYTKGTLSLLLALLLHSPHILLALVGLCTFGKVKEHVFSWLYRGTSLSQFQQWGQEFAPLCTDWLNGSVVQRLRWHQASGHKVYVISASIDEWVRPICTRLGIEHVIATQVETDRDGRLTGRFLTPNCKGTEKVHRLRAAEPHLADSQLYAYGNSRDDEPLLQIADVAERI